MSPWEIPSARKPAAISVTACLYSFHEYVVYPDGDGLLQRGRIAESARSFIQDLIYGTGTHAMQFITCCRVTR